MPYTFAHPGYVLYLRQKYFRFLSANGLVFGSISPDLDILFRLLNVRHHLFSYKIGEVLLIIFPLTLLMAWAFHRYIRDTLIRFLPEPWAGNCRKYTGYDFNAYLRSDFAVFALSAFAGIYLHLILDYLVHWNAHYVMMFFHAGIYPIPFMMPVYYYAGWYLPLIFSSLLGIYLLLRHFGLTKEKLVQTARGFDKARLGFWSLFAVVGLLWIVFRFIVSGKEPGYAFHYLITHSTSAVLVSLVVTTMMVRLLGAIGRTTHRKRGV